MPSGAPPTAIRWLHVPKAGSAFINVAARFGCRDVEPAALPAFEVALNFTRWRESNPHVRCPGLLPSWAGHRPVQKHELRQRVLVAIFRRPAQRLLSGFHHREDGHPQSMIAPGMAPAQRLAMRRACRGDPGAYARWPGIAGCATKMILGWSCASDRALRPADVSRAVRVMRDHFAYVGLTEHWETSVCVFHRMMRQPGGPSPSELALTHLGPLRTHHSTPAAFEYDESPLRGFTDEADEAVYAAVSERFWADARRTGCANLHS